MGFLERFLVLFVVRLALSNPLLWLLQKGWLRVRREAKEVNLFWYIPAAMAPFGEDSIIVDCVKGR